MTKTKIFNVNLQEGFLISESEHIVAAFSRHQQAILWKSPSAHKFCAVPDEFVTYASYHYATDSFSISAWDSASHKTIPIVDLVMQSEDIS